VILSYLLVSKHFKFVRSRCESGSGRWTEPDRKPKTEPHEFAEFVPEPNLYDEWCMNRDPEPIIAYELVRTGLQLLRLKLIGKLLYFWNKIQDIKRLI
jgi:hypothetical protein